MSEDTSAAEPLVPILLTGIPLSLHSRAQAHGDELTREFRLIAEQLREHPDAHLPRRLVDLTDQLAATYGMLTEEQEDELEAALASGAASIDLAYLLPAHVAEAATTLGEVLDEADDYCRAGQHLLTLATPDDCVAYRRWFLEEFVRQARGAAPTPWAESPYAAGID
jgi:hypothetical protein